MKYTAKEYIQKHKGEYENNVKFIKAVERGIADIKDPENSNVHQVMFFEEVLAELLKTDPIYGIIERKKQGTDCTEAESAQVKGWLRDIPIPFEQPTFNDVKTLFPIEYNEFLEEVEIHYKKSLDKHYNDVEPQPEPQPKPERKYYIITCHVANVFTNDSKQLTDAEFIEFAKAEGLIFSEAEFIETFNTGVHVISSQKQYLRII